MLVNHLGAGPRPPTDNRAVDMGLNAQADEGMSALVRLAVRDLAFL